MSSSLESRLLPATPDLESYKDAWGFIEFIEGELFEISLETLGAASKVARKAGMKVGAVVLGYKIREDILRELIYRGADYVVYADHPELEHYNPIAYTETLYQIVSRYKPWALFFMADDLGRDLGPRVAYRLNTGMAADCIDFDVKDFDFKLAGRVFKNLLAQIRPAAIWIAEIYTPRHRPQIAGVRPGYFKPPERDPGRSGEIMRFEPEIPPEAKRYRVLKVEKLPEERDPLREAELVVSLGMGILKRPSGAPEPVKAYEMARELAEYISSRMGVKTALGASRALIHAELKELEGLITHDMQVGQTGKAVSPKIYVACGISGAVQHRVGMQSSENIIAINTDPNAPIFEIATHVIVEDLYEALPKILQALKKRLGE
ncbi:MAG: electron transfer flavoprotein subunit alpha/FixB family protein [Sulfolobales archaeon]